LEIYKGGNPMHHEEVTFSEELMKEPSWKEWMRENRMFLAVIGILSLLSLILLLENQWNGPSTEKVIAPLQEPLPQRPTPKPKLLKKNHTQNPIDEAKELFLSSQTQKAIALLLKIAKENSDSTLQEEASTLAKRYYHIQEEQEKIKKYYLQGYVLFLNYPKEACDEWAKVLTSSLTEDPYYEKAQKRWKENCTSRMNLIER